MRGRLRQAAEVAAIAVLGHGVVTFGLVQDGRFTIVEFLANAVVVLIFVSAAWFTLLTLRSRTG